jgi:hypothetical protein
MVLCELPVLLLVPDPSRGEDARPPTCNSDVQLPQWPRFAASPTTQRCGCFRFERMSVEKEGHGPTRYPESDLSIATAGLGALPV